MNQKQRKQITYWLSVIVVGIALGLALQFVRAWTEPTSSPPNGNVGAPINTSSTAQTKTGDLNVKGGMVIGSATDGSKGVGTINATQFCLSGKCISDWPTGTTINTGGDTTIIADPHCCGNYICGSTYDQCIGANETSAGTLCTFTCETSGWSSLCSSSCQYQY
jgi:hypothetical protein